MSDVRTVRFAWSKAPEQAFKIIKDTICMAPELALSKEAGEYVLKCDISKYAVGAVLLPRRQDGETRAIAF